MRVISGTCKGLLLKAVPGSSTRPTSDRVKEALFHRIGPYFDGGIGLDLYSGSGALGIEALSRGFDEVYFVDRLKSAVRVIRTNVERANMTEKAHVIQSDARRALRRFEANGIVFDLIFLDPPYGEHRIQNDMDIIVKGSLLASNGLIVAEHAASEPLQAIPPLIPIDERKYGDTFITIFQQSHV